jgi:hypothetical protein
LSKIVTSGVKGFTGTVTLVDPLTYPVYTQYLDALEAAQEHRTERPDLGYLALLPGVLACVESFQVDGVPEHATVDTFPATPARRAAEFLGFLVVEVSGLITEAEIVPN